MLEFLTVALAARGLAHGAFGGKFAPTSRLPREEPARLEILASVSRIDNVFGDRHPVCTCAGMDEYQSR